MNTKAKRNLPSNFVCAFRGIFACIKTERHIRIHMAAAFYVALFSFMFYYLTDTKICCVALTMGFVVVAEMLNTAIEKAVDIASPEYNKLAGIAKDIAAGAVLISAIVAVVVGFFVYWDLDKFSLMYNYFADNTTELILLVISVVAWIAFIVLTPKKDKLKGMCDNGHTE